jgi:hypothetical protein
MTIVVRSVGWPLCYCWRMLADIDGSLAIYANLSQKSSRMLWLTLVHPKDARHIGS